MCQPKAQGGKRCLRHAAASQFTVRVTTVKTGADAETVEKILSQLNKEGKKLPSPETTEVKQWLETKRFATEFDPELDDHERKIQTNQLNRAEKEVEQGVTGGQFHAWKNVLNTVRENLGRKVAAAGLTGLMAVSLVGCFQQNPQEPPVSSDSSQSQLVDLQGTGNVVTDEYGEYEKVEINQESEAYQFTTDKVDMQALSTWSEEDLAQAQQYGVNYFVNEFIDSSALDTGATGYATWHSTTAPTYYSPSLLSDAAVQDGSANIILTNAATNQIPILIRDGKPRERSLSLTVDGLSSGVAQDGSNFVDVNLSYSTEYRVSDASAITFGANVSGLSEADFMNSSIPKDSLRDGTGENIYKVDGWIRIGISKTDTGWQIAGLQSESNFSTADFANR